MVSNLPVPPEPLSSETKPIQIVVNGESRQAPPSLNLSELLEFLEVDASRVAIEHNRSIVRRPEWNSTTIRSGDELEIVQFVGGG
jgi:sulfur carrier protein